MPHLHSPAIDNLERREERRQVISSRKTLMKQMSMTSQELPSTEKAAKTFFLNHQHRLIRKWHQTFFYRHFSLEGNIKIGPAHPFHHLFPPHSARWGISSHQATKHTVLSAPCCHTWHSVCLWESPKCLFFFFKSSFTACLGFMGGTEWTFTVKTEEMIQVKEKNRQQGAQVWEHSIAWRTQLPLIQYASADAAEDSCFHRTTQLGCPATCGLLICSWREGSITLRYLEFSIIKKRNTLLLYSGKVILYFFRQFSKEAILKI